jgi:hypothetical protein
MDKDRLQMYISVTKITIVLCWLSLFSFWAIKIFGGNWFEIIVENENFIKFSDKVQNTWLKYLVSFITIFVSYYLMFGAVAQNIRLKGSKLVFYILSALLTWVTVNFVNIFLFEMFSGYVLIFIFGFVYQDKFKKMFGVLAIILDFLFSTISMLVRSIELSMITDYLILLIGCIDFYIMYGLYFLYANLSNLKKGI